MAKVVYVGGTFDLLHVGHVRLLKKAKALGDFLVVALNTDSFCEEYKRKPIIPYSQRKEMLKALSCVDTVIENTGGKDSKPSILHAKPSIIVHGDDWKGASFMKQLGVDASFLKKNKIKLVYLPYTESASSTEIIKRCSQR